MRKVMLLRRLLEQDIVKIPFYIDTRKYTHKVIWDKLQMIIQHISKLTAFAFLTERNIKKIVYDVNDLLDTISSFENSTLILMIISDIISKTNEYLEASLEFELYEISNNLTIFLNIFMKSNVELNENKIINGKF